MSLILQRLTVLNLSIIGSFLAVVSPPPRLAEVLFELQVASPPRYEVEGVEPGRMVGNRHFLRRFDAFEVSHRLRCVPYDVQWWPRTVRLSIGCVVGRLALKTG